MSRCPRVARALGLALSLAAATAVTAGSPRASEAQPARGPARPQVEAPPPDAGPPPREISLPQVLEHAVRHSPQLAAARIDITIAEASVLEATGIEDWVLTAAGHYLRRRAEAGEGNLIGTDAVDRYSASVGIGKLLFTGGRISLTAEAERSRQKFALAMGDVTVEHSTSVTAQLSQPLLRGFGQTTTRANQTRAEVARDAARLEKDAAARTMVRELVAAYWELAYAIADLEIRRSSVDLARERRRLTEASARGGAVAPTEVLAVDQVIAGREEEVVAAEQNVLERSLAMRRLAGLEIAPGELGLSVTAPLEVAPRSPELDAVVAAAFDASPEIASLAARDRGARLEIEVTENGLLPRLDLNVYGGPLGTSNKFSEAVEQTARFDGYQVGADLELEHEFGRNRAHGASRRAHAERQRLTVDIADMRAQIAQAAVQAVSLARSAEKRLALSRTAIELSEKNIKAETGRFELGKSTNFDVLLRQDELKQARLRYARAVADYLRASASIGALTGEILPQYGIKIDKD